MDSEIDKVFYRDENLGYVSDDLGAINIMYLFI